MAKVTEQEKKYLYVDGDGTVDIDVLEPDEGDPVYTVDECCEKSWTAFNASPDIVRAAFAFAGITTATKAQAIDLVEEFRNKSAG